MKSMMRGMTAKIFDPVRYSGRWFEVASLKRGFAGQGQEDCHCTQVKSNILCSTVILLVMAGYGIYQKVSVLPGTGMVSSLMQ